MDAAHTEGPGLARVQTDSFLGMKASYREVSTGDGGYPTDFPISTWMIENLGPEPKTHRNELLLSIGHLINWFRDHKMKFFFSGCLEF